MPKKKHNITTEKLAKSDCYRMQIQLNYDDKRHIAIMYNALADMNQELASRLRDGTNSVALGHFIEHMRTILAMKDQSFQKFLPGWVRTHVSPEEISKTIAWVKAKYGVTLAVPSEPTDQTLPL